MADQIDATEAPHCADVDCQATPHYQGTLGGEVAYYCDLHKPADAKDVQPIRPR